MILGFWLGKCDLSTDTAIYGNWEVQFRTP